MRPVTMYEAEDGKLFRDEDECLTYDRRAKLTDEVLDRIKVWDNYFDPLEISVKNLNWTKTGEYFFAPDKECREALNYAFDQIGYSLPFTGMTEKSNRVKWSDETHEFIDFDALCEKIESMRKAMN